MYYQLKITLKGVRPAVWRRIVVPDKLTLHQLHNVLQVAFNWTNTHLYTFDLPCYEFDYMAQEVLEEEELKTVKLKDFVHDEEKFSYCYDFGDNWVHQIVIERIMEIGADIPICSAGRRNTPPEDCGGAWNYNRLMKEKAANTLSEEDQEILEFHDPDYFDIDKVFDLLSDGKTIYQEGFF